MLSLIQKACRECIAFLHDLIDNNSDAGRTGRAAIRNLDVQIRQAEESVTDVDAELRLAQNDALKARADAEIWRSVAERAAAAGEREAAIEAVQQEVQAEELQANYEANAARLAPMVAQLKARLSDLRLKKKDLEHKTSLLSARSKVAKAESRAARYLGNVGNTPGVDFNEAERRVDRQEAKAAALVDMAQERTEADPNTRLQAFVRRDAMDEKLRRLGLPAQAPVAAIADNKEVRHV